MLDGLLKEQIQNDIQMSGMLTSYNGKPAFFYQKSPSDTAEFWCKPCYPRADYNIDVQYNTERKTNGILTINIWCSSESQTMPEDIEKRFRELIDGTFYSIPKQDTVCAMWNRSDAFSFEGNKANLNNDGQPEIFGITMLFELTEFPLQLTTDPDPIQGINEWTKINFPKLMITAHDILLPIWKPSNEQPAVYWRFIGTDSDNKQSNYSVTWFIGQFAAHIMTNSVTERNRWLKAIAEHLQTDGEIILPDSSPMFIKQIQINHNADPLRDGQIVVSGQYGVLTQHRKEQAQIKLNNVNYNYKR